MANSTTILADLKTVLLNNSVTIKPATLANASAAAAVTATGGAGNFTGGTGVYASGSYPGGVMDYFGALTLVHRKAQEIAVLLTRILANTDQSTDGTNQTLLVNILNDFQ